MSDGAFGMSGFYLETTVRAGVAITTLVINNGANVHLRRSAGHDRPGARAAGVSTMSGNYAALVGSLGAHEVRSAPERRRPLTEAQIWPAPSLRRAGGGRGGERAAVALTDMESLIDSHRHG